MKQKHDVRVNRDLLHPLLNYYLDKLLEKCAKAGIYLIITEGFRTVEYQDSLYAKGRTTSGSIVTNAKGITYSSQHQWGIAFDIAINDTQLLYNEKKIAEVAKIAKKIGLKWGGDWKSIKDTPHFYLGTWGSTTTDLKLKYGTPGKFKATWTKKIKGTKNGLSIWNTTHTKIIKKNVPNGEIVNILHKAKKPINLGFYKVEYKGTVGIMNGKYLSGV